MKKIYLFVEVILTTVLAVQFVSCTDKEQDEIGLDNSIVEKRLQEYAIAHNSGLEYIKSDAEKHSGTYTKNRLDSIFWEYLIYKYGNAADKILSEINPMKELLFNGTIPSLQQTRSGGISGFTDQANVFVLEALNDCMIKITNRLNSANEDELLDNKSLLNDLHAVINETYVAYAKKSNSDADTEALAQTLGVLYGSIEYWTNSKNVQSWLKINLKEDENIDYVPASAFNGPLKEKRKGKDEDDDKKLPLNEWIETVAAADATGCVMGAPVGGAIGAGALGLAASAAAAAYYDVKEE